MGMESNHWYSRDGKPCYEVPAKGGGLRPADLRDARKLSLVPSVTTVLGVVAKPQLENWKVDQGILAALTLPRLPDEAESDWLLRVKRDSKQQAISAADKGTEIHDAIERSFKGQIIPHEHRAIVSAVRDLLDREFPEVTDWVSEASFAHPSGFGGKVDLHSPSHGIVLDFKGKDGDFSDGKKLAYDQHWQLAAYGHGLGMQNPVGVNVFFSRTHPAAVLHRWDGQEMSAGLDVFFASLQLWKALKKFDAGF